MLISQCVCISLVTALNKRSVMLLRTLLDWNKWPSESAIKSRVVDLGQKLLWKRMHSSELPLLWLQNFLSWFLNLPYGPRYNLTCVCSFYNCKDYLNRGSWYTRTIFHNLDYFITTVVWFDLHVNSGINQNDGKIRKWHIFETAFPGQLTGTVEKETVISFSLISYKIPPFLELSSNYFCIISCRRCAAVSPCFCHTALRGHRH